ncbi:G patch domain and ankyrin repeat-containing protein 1 [Desmophyllum pertusum]|uniref:G patch domain and ankyrin repeat-containing protein 1 n=1 Tax=Desmophyllum pertusum TaxID=174260 RepID=A0A9X0CSJ7_9CNID|nr:G patch domain and ankyrin repeat-containing protein 1 [Desmophyllum pertusum]
MKLSSYALQRFVSPKEGKDPIFSKVKTKCEQGNMSGEEARTFYETVLSSDSSDVQDVVASNTREQDTSRKRRSDKLHNSRSAIKRLSSTGDDVDMKKSSCLRSRSRKLRTPSSSHHRLVNDFLKHAQEGSLKQVQELLADNSIDINACDQFSWTALMCASHGGQIHIVKYLLEKGASWKCHKDLQGRTALDLAKLAGHLDVVELLTTYSSRTKRKREKIRNKCPVKKTKFWCSICEQEFTDDKKIHEGSTVHLFNIQRKPQRTFYYIPEGNVGYQMMFEGWLE